MEHRPAHFQRANASRVTEALWIGGDLEVFDEGLAMEQLVELDAAGLTDIVDVRIERDDSDWATAEFPHLGYLHLGVDDAGQQMPDEWFEQGVHHILSELSDPGARVLVHCHMGINRGPSMGFAVLLAQGWDPIEALDAIRDARPIAFISYAEDALDWWLRSNNADHQLRGGWQRRLREWRLQNHLDVGEAIRMIRREEDRRLFGGHGAV